MLVTALRFLSNIHCINKVTIQNNIKGMINCTVLFFMNFTISLLRSEQKHAPLIMKNNGM